MDPILFFALPAAVATGSAMICYVLMKARMDVAVAREKTERAHIEARLEMAEEMLPERLKAAEDSAQRRTFDHVMGGFRVEERRYLREDGSSIPTLVLQERLFYRNVPLSHWIEHELPSGAGASETVSVFTSRARLTELAAFGESQRIEAPAVPTTVIEPPSFGLIAAPRRGPQLLRARTRKAAV